MSDIDPTRPEARAVAPDLEGLTVAVTGANGFVGARTCTLFADAGADVAALVRRGGSAPAGDRVVEHVVTLDDEEALASAMQGADVVVHTAAAAGQDLEHARSVNVEGTRHVLTAARAAGVARVVHVSTVAVHDADATGGTIAEDSPLVGDDGSPYAVTKREAEQVVAEEDVPAVVLRPPAVLGWSPSSTWGQEVPDWVADGELPMAPDPRDDWSWVHVDDLAVAIALAATDDDAIGRTYLVSSGDSDWGTYLGRVHSWSPDAPSPFIEAEEEPTTRRVSSERARSELGWTPTIDLDDSLDEVAAHHA